MRQGYDDRLCRWYPLLYRDRHGDKMSTLMCWGFSCGDGWFELIDTLSAKLELQLMRMKYEQGIPEEELPAAVQVKEKFGGLRFYMTHGTDEIFDLIQIAENKSFLICEDCGRRGRPRNERSWVRTLCDECNGTK